MVRPLIKYACVVWEPHYQSQVSALEKVQKCAVKWALSDYSYHSSVFYARAAQLVAPSKEEKATEA